jgi:hypothetical protein
VFKQVLHMVTTEHSRLLRFWFVAVMNLLGGACGTYGGGERGAQGVGGET